ncbi:MAG: nitroreductase/quinone reductase family protein [Chloroflexaceae bacterium]
MALHGFDRWLYRGGRPNRLARLLNAIWAAVYALGVAPNYLVTLQVPGRRSGRLIVFPLVMAVVDGERYLVAMLGENAAWVQNLQARHGHALLRHGRVEDVCLEAIPVDQRGRVLQVYLQRAPGARAHLPVSADAPREAFDAIAPRIPVFRVSAVPPP